MISNKTLYEKGKVENLSKLIEHQPSGRRCLDTFCIFRILENTPAQTAFSFAIESDNLFIGRLLDWVDLE